VKEQIGFADSFGLKIKRAYFYFFRKVRDARKTDMGYLKMKIMFKIFAISIDMFIPFWA